MSTLKVKDLAKQYNINPTIIIRELEEQGIPAESPDSAIPEDMVELVESYFADLYDQEDEIADKRSSKNSKGSKKAPQRGAF